MDSRIGLDFIVENPEYIRKLAAALDTNNVTVKKQIFELLSALCVYNEEGHARALDTLEHYKVTFFFSSLLTTFFFFFLNDFVSFVLNKIFSFKEIKRREI